MASLAEKRKIKKRNTLLFLDAPADYRRTLGKLPSDVKVITKA
ncbi:MAG: hypothetical protein ACRDFQ_03615 [Anaerolineales bacterium]